MNSKNRDNLPSKPSEKFGDGDVELSDSSKIEVKTKVR